ncbi:sigma factor [Cupriavidus campinensis]|uniref:RNA polymerase sigma-70 region 2 domain-containing protein n=1 Tax=Cupriavidus campinensis TaxID=151783 RepID=A0ABY3ESP5_9BURK|nr:sigma factor [Cupriavidus campinensis]TSP13993.1 hypothetical protein FGG12_05850 [Cupriavidus campinensis]
MTNLTEAYRQNEGLIHLVTRQCYGWVRSLGLSMDYNDVLQEVSVVFLQAQASFDEGRGLKFSAYFTRAAINEIRRVIGSHTGMKRLNMTEREALKAKQARNKVLAAAGEATESVYSGLDMVSFADLTQPDGSDFESTIADDGETPEQILERRQEWEALHASLSPVASLIAKWLIDPPEELLRELEAHRAHVELCLELGERKRTAYYEVCVAEIGKLLRLSGVPKEKVVLATAELERAAANWR